jgi:hypothetical protein
MIDLKTIIIPGAKVGDVIKKIVESSTPENNEELLSKFVEIYPTLVITEEDKELVIKEIPESFDTG